MAGTVNRANYGWLFLIPRNCLNYHNIYLFAMNILCLTIIQMKRFSFFYRLRRFRFELRIFFQIVWFLSLVFIFQIQIVHGVFCLWSSWKKIKDNCTHCVQPQHADLTLGATGNGGIWVNMSHCVQQEIYPSSKVLCSLCSLTELLAIGSM